MVKKATTEQDDDFEKSRTAEKVGQGRSGLWGLFF